MPINGIRGPNHEKAAPFRWRTPRVLFTGIILLWGIGIDLLYLKRIIRIGINAKNFGKYINVH